MLLHAEIFCKYPCWIQISALKLKWLCRDVHPNWVQEITVMTTALMGPEWQCKSILYGEHGKGYSLVTVFNASSYITANMIWTANINIKIHDTYMWCALQPTSMQEITCYYSLFVTADSWCRIGLSLVHYSLTLSNIHYQCSVSIRILMTAKTKYCRFD